MIFADGDHKRGRFFALRPSSEPNKTFLGKGSRLKSVGTKSSKGRNSLVFPLLGGSYVSEVRS